MRNILLLIGNTADHIRLKLLLPYSLETFCLVFCFISDINPPPQMWLQFVLHFHRCSSLLGAFGIWGLHKFQVPDRYAQFSKNKTLLAEQLMRVHLIISLTRSREASQEFFNNCPAAFHGNVVALLRCATATRVIKDIHIFGIVCHDSVSCVAPRSMDSSQMSCKTNKNSRLPGHPNCFHITLGAASTESCNRQR